VATGKNQTARIDQAKSSLHFKRVFQQNRPSAGTRVAGNGATLPTFQGIPERPVWSGQFRKSNVAWQSEAGTRLAAVNVSPWPVRADEKSSSAPIAKACRTPARRACVAPRSAGLAPRAQRVRHHAHRACLNAAPAGRVVSCAMRAQDRAPQGSRRVQRLTATVKRRAGVRRACAAPAQSFNAGQFRRQVSQMPCGTDNAPEKYISNNHRQCDPRSVARIRRGWLALQDTSPK
jgi:hypothetical protein